MSRFTWTVVVQGIDVSPLVIAGGTIDYGRGTELEAYAAPTAEFEMMTPEGFEEYSGDRPIYGLDPDGYDPSEVVSLRGVAPVILGAEVFINVSTPSGFTTGYNPVYVEGVSARRFTGVIQAVDWRWGRVRVTAVGTIADLALLVAGATSSIAPRTEESDADRVTWLATDAGVTINIEGTDGPDVREIPVNTPDSELLAQLIDIAEDCGALLYQQRDGTMVYQPYNWVQGPAYSVPEHLVHRDEIGMVTERGTIVNQVRVEYGDPDPSTGLYSYSEYNDGSSQLQYGLRSRVFPTQLADDLGADAIAERLYLAFKAQWTLTDLPMILAAATDTEILALWTLDLGYLVDVTGLPITVGSTYEGRLIGMTEVMHPDDYIANLHLAYIYDYPES